MLKSFVPLLRQIFYEKTHWLNVSLYALCLLAAWRRTGRGLSVGVVSPYGSQVDAIKGKLGKTYDTCDGFQVRVKSDFPQHR